MSNNAITVEPSIQFTKSTVASADAEAVETMIIDSGEDDLNRTISRKTVPSLDVKSFKVDGFSRPYYFNNETEMLQALEAILEHAEENGSLKGIKAGNEVEKSTPFCLVCGDVSVVYEDEVVKVASPVYRLHPNKKGEYLAFDVIHSYIHNSWLDSFRTAIMPTPEKGKAIGSGSNAISQLDSNTMLKMALIASLLILAIVLVFKFTANQGLSASSSSGATSYNSPQLTGATKLTASASGSNPSIHQQLQIDQTKQLLKDMNIDLDSNAQDLGCFTN